MKGFIFFIFFCFLVTRSYCQDTIHLNEVKIDKKSQKKEKRITVKKGFKGVPHLGGIKDYYNYYYFYKLEFPFGRPLALTLYFIAAKDSYSTPDDRPVESRMYEIDLFTTDGSGGVGECLTKSPLVINLGESDDPWDRQEQLLDLREFSFYGNSLYLRVNTPIKQKCTDCFQYRFTGYRPTGQSSEMRMEKAAIQDNSYPAPSPEGYELRFKMDVLTNK
jgi:hypothetical protein